MFKNRKKKYCDTASMFLIGALAGGIAAYLASNKLSFIKDCIAENLSEQFLENIKVNFVSSEEDCNCEE